MDRCAYCGAHCDGSEEHVIQSALGGRVVSKRIACSSCNNSFSSTTGGDIDKAVAKTFEIPRNLLCVFSGRNQPPPVLRNAGRLDGVPYDMLPGGVPQLRMVRKVEVSQGHTNVTLVAGTIEVARAQVAHLQRQYGEELDFQAARIGGRWATEPAEFTITLGDSAECRGVAKMGFNLLASSRLIDVHSSEFDAMRKFVREGATVGDVGCHVDFINSFPLPQAEDDTAHVVTVVADPNARHVVAYVSLFGGVRYSAVLSDSYSGPSFAVGLRHGCENRHREVFRDIEIPPSYDRSVIQRYTELAEQHWDGANAAFSKICRRYFDVARVKAIGEIVDRAKAAAGLKGETNEGEQIDVFEAEFASGIERYLLRNDHSREISMEDLLGDSPSF